MKLPTIVNQISIFWRCCILVGLAIVVANDIACSQTNTTMAEYINYANNHFKLGRIELGIKILESAQKEYPNSDEISKRLASAYHSLGLSKKARTLMSTVDDQNMSERSNIIKNDIHQTVRAMKDQYESAVQTGSSSRMGEYLKKFPNSYLRKEAEEKYSNFLEIEEFQKAKGIDTPHSYDKFVAKYPNSKFRNQALNFREEAQFRIEKEWREIKEFYNKGGSALLALAKLKRISNISPNSLPPKVQKRMQYFKFVTKTTKLRSAKLNVERLLDFGGGGRAVHGTVYMGEIVILVPYRGRKLVFTIDNPDIVLKSLLNNTQLSTEDIGVTKHGGNARSIPLSDTGDYDRIPNVSLEYRVSGRTLPMGMYVLAGTQVVAKGTIGLLQAVCKSGNCDDGSSSSAPTGPRWFVKKETSGGRIIVQCRNGSTHSIMYVKSCWGGGSGYSTGVLTFCDHDTLEKAAHYYCPDY